MITLYVLAFIIASLLYRRRHRHIDMRTVRRLELERYMGRWYEIARYDRPFERRLRNIEARYTLRADGNVEMERAGIDIRTGFSCGNPYSSTSAAVCLPSIKSSPIPSKSILISSM